MWSEVINYLNQNSGAIQAVSTIALVLITIYYAIQTKFIVNETSNSRKDTRLPIIRVEMRGPINLGRPHCYIGLTFENIGYGLARNIKVFFPGKEKVTVKNINIGETDSYDFELAVGDEIILNDLPESEKIVLVEYDDIFGRKVKTLANFAHTDRGSWIEFEITDWKPIMPN